MTLTTSDSFYDIIVEKCILIAFTKALDAQFTNLGVYVPVLTGYTVWLRRAVASKAVIMADVTCISNLTW